MKLRQHNVTQLKAAFELLPTAKRAGQMAHVKVDSVETRIDTGLADDGDGFEPGEVEDVSDAISITFVFVVALYRHSAFEGDVPKEFLEWELIR